MSFLLARRSRRSVHETLPEAVHLVTLVVGAVVLLVANRNQWFFGDEWDFIASRSGTDLRDLFAPHNEHWSTVPILVYRAMIRTFGLASYRPFVVVLIASHLALCFALRRLLLQVGADPWVSTFAVGVFVVLGSGFENLLWAFQIGFIGSVLAGVLLLLLLNHDGPADRRDVAATVLAVVALTFSGVTVTMIAIAALCTWMRRGLRDALRFAAIPALVYLAWLLAIGREGLGTHPTTLDSLFLLPQYMWRGIGTGIDVTLATAGVGLLLFLALALWLVLNDGFVGQRGAAATACFVGVVVLFFIVGVGRAELGTAQAESSRYVYIEAALLVPASALAVTALVRRRRERLVVVAAAAAAVAFTNVGLLRAAAISEAAREQRIRGQIVAAAELVTSEAPTLTALVEPTFSPDLQADALPTLVEHGLPHETRPMLDRLNAAAQLQVAVFPGAAEVRPARLVEQIDVTSSPARDGCLDVVPAGAAPQLVLEVAGQPAHLVVEVPAATEFTVTLRGGTPTVVAADRTLPLVAGPNQLQLAATRTSPVLSVPAGGFSVCGLETD